MLKAGNALIRSCQSAQGAEHKLTATLRKQEQEAIDLGKISIHPRADRIGAKCK